MVQTGALESAAKLRAQLADLQSSRPISKAVSGQLDEEIKPENIERGLAGAGSTHPEDLREARRRLSIMSS